MLCGSEGWDDMHLWAFGREDWLKSFLDLPPGIPSADCLRRVFAKLHPKSFREGFQSWA